MVADVVTDLIDLSAMGVNELSSRHFGDFLHRQLRDVDRPRTNMGGSSPPGYAGYDKPSARDESE